MDFPTCPFLFTGQRFDPETALYYYKRRFYIPPLGRFLSRDPISYGAGEFNLYRYVENRPTNENNLYRYVLDNPCRGTDPLGLLIQLAPLPAIANPPVGVAIALGGVALCVGYGTGYLPGRYISGPLTGKFFDWCYGNPPLTSPVPVPFPLPVNVPVDTKSKKIKANATVVGRE